MTAMVHARLASVVIAVSAAALTTCTVRTGNAAVLQIYGGPTYSTSAGGYVATHDSLPPAEKLYVNDAGMAAATVFKYGGSESPLGQRAVRWSAFSTPAELRGDPTSLFAQGINNAGTVIGQTAARTGSPFPFDQYFSPARWAPSGTAVTVLEHPYSSPPFVGVPILGDINDAGTAVGLVSLTTNLGSRAGRWDATGTALTQLGDLGTDPDGFTQAEAEAINPAGVAVGNAQKYDASGRYLGYQAVRWEPSGIAATPLGHLGELANNPSQAPDGFTESQAFAINGVGTVVGYSNVYDESGVQLRTHVPVRWDAAGAPTELGTGPTPGATIAWSPAALNDAGTAVGWTDALGAVRWDASGTEPMQLGDIGGTFTIHEGEAWAINNAGIVVGWAEKNDSAGQHLGQRAVYWATDGLAVDLNTLIDPTGGWLLNRASGISDTGWIVGLGTFDPDGLGGQASYSRHFLINVPATAVPEPGTGVLLSIAMAFAAVHFAVRRRTYGTGLLCACLCLAGLAASATPARADILYAADRGRIVSFTSSGVGTVFANSVGANDLRGLAFDSAGNLYAANNSDGTIEKFTPDGVGSIFASTGLSLPQGLAFDSAGNLYAANHGTNTIEKFTPDGVGSTFADTGLNSPTGLAFDSAGNLYAATINNTIEKFTPDGVHTLFATTDIQSPYALAFDSAGDLYVSSSYYVFNRVLKYSPSGGVSTFAAGVPSLGLAFDSAGDLYTADWLIDGTVIRYSPEGGIGSVFVSSGILESPKGLAFTDDAGVPLRLANQVPEPSTLVFGAAGLASLAAFQWRRRRVAAQRSQWP